MKPGDLLRKRAAGGIERSDHVLLDVGQRISTNPTQVPRGGLALLVAVLQPGFSTWPGYATVHVLYRDVLHVSSPDDWTVAV